MNSKWLEEKRQHLTHKYDASENLTLGDLQALVSDKYYFHLSNPERLVAAKARDKKRHEATREMNTLHREAQQMDKEREFKKLSDECMRMFDEHGVYLDGIQYFYDGIPVMNKRITRSTIEKETENYLKAMEKIKRLAGEEA